MHTPTKAQWAKVIENFYKILPLTFEAGHGHLDMDQPLVNLYPSLCGTVHCAGGWYAIAALDCEKQELSFKDGARQMAMDLGFIQADDIFLSSYQVFELEQWAKAHHKIWGNGHGGEMFYDAAAYNGAQTIEQVIHHLEGVHDRSPK